MLTHTHPFCNYTWLATSNVPNTQYIRVILYLYKIKKLNPEVCKTFKWKKNVYIYISYDNKFQRPIYQHMAIKAHVISRILKSLLYIRRNFIILNIVDRIFFSKIVFCSIFSHTSTNPFWNKSVFLYVILI